ncbi:hypothetical protein Bca4012_025988 [Brassica carinata]|uniref:Uncharacterized protein n=1 Tax=Brassica carinata TaxID=52824 RepID=A0A8X7VHR3_BRACI|nr:hypothetical protein Bca52824_022970 [Brassica carinata]
MVSLFCFLLRWKLWLSPSDTFFAYGLHSPVVYRFLWEYFGCVDWSSISSCFDLPTTPLYKVLQAHLSSLFSTYSAIEWFKEIFGCVKLELRFMILACDIPMGLVSFGYTFATSSNIYIALTRSSAVCSFLTSSILDIGIVLVSLSSWWQVEEKLIVIFIPMSMDLADYDFPLVPRLNQSSFLIFLPIWNELDEQASLVLQGSSSHRMLFSAYGAVCVVLRVTLDAVFEEAYEVVVIRFHMVPFCDLYRHLIHYVIIVAVCLAANSLFVSSFAGV